MSENKLRSFIDGPPTEDMLAKRKHGTKHQIARGCNPDDATLCYDAGYDDAIELAREVNDVLVAAIRKSFWEERLGNGRY